MKKELNINTFSLNQRIIMNSKLDKNIKVCNKITGKEFIINNKTLNMKIDTNKIVVDCDLINIHKISKNTNLKEGNKLVNKIYNKIKNNITISIKSYKVINYDERLNYFLNQLLYMIIAYQINDIEKRYSYIYDIICDELDRRFKLFNICSFENNICSRKKCVKQLPVEQLIYGCCYTKNRICPNLKNNQCTIKCISCKLFTCSYLKKKGIKYDAKDFLLIKNFFNNKQINIINDTLFTDKNEIIKILLKNKKKIRSLI